MKVDVETFKQAMGRLATGVSVITTKSNDKQNFGLTASSVTSLTAEPPMLLVCVHKDTGTRDAITESGYFTVHVLGEDQEDLAIRFAKPNPDKFAGLHIKEGEFGTPLLTDYFVRVECKVEQEAVGGTHSVFMGEMLKIDIQEKEPLLYFKGEFGEFVSTK
ncbi:flavin reductase family protein [Alteribacillus bidgolensis]|uniref:NADH-FMN oxidoreductase RutF, flavin reductase (DIM6/NTAB) family n=1 Tax=Alteribacillus bidgolensis TaxID=930129 RepID=A0A1G8IE08_9BACI|nr:flavin reductase family protein [Alteribacillus bidgolensis]SDI17037.1 NADH-FMN oxidoreductase RutF, flavin reductase (DIM6/NTAB) family [Alteribacillus bidgolensis]